MLPDKNVSSYKKHELKQIERKDYVTYVECKICGEWWIGTLQEVIGKMERNEIKGECNDC